MTEFDFNNKGTLLFPLNGWGNRKIKTLRGHIIIRKWKKLPVPKPY